MQAFGNSRKNFIPMLFHIALGSCCAGLQERNGQQGKGLSARAGLLFCPLILFVCFNFLILDNICSEEQVLWPKSFENHQTRCPSPLQAFYESLTILKKSMWQDKIFKSLALLHYLDPIYYHFVPGFPGYALVPSIDNSHFVFKRVNPPLFSKQPFYLYWRSNEGSLC